MSIGEDDYDPRPGINAVIERKNAEIKRLRLENWQLKGALGYPVPSDIPEGNFKCGLCDARRKSVPVP